MNTLQLAFDYQTLPVRTITDGVTIWFVLKDVCEVLGIVDDKQVYNRLDEDERGGYKTPTPGGLQEMRCVNEPGLYDTIIRSNSERAKPFRRWVTHEVLPSIRKQGYYSTLPDNQLLNMLSDRLRENPKLISDTILSERQKNSLKVYDMEEQIRQLWEKRSGYDANDYNRELARICNYSVTRYNREWQKYVRWSVSHTKNQAEALIISKAVRKTTNREQSSAFLKGMIPLSDKKE